MVTKLITVLEDDLDGSEAQETVSFQLDGIAYDIDLNPAHADELRSALRPYLQAGRKHRNTASGRRPTPRRGRPSTAQVRAWAQEQGIPVNDRGRVGEEILAQYEAAH